MAFGTSKGSRTHYSGTKMDTLPVHCTDNVFEQQFIINTTIPTITDKPLRKKLTHVSYWCQHCHCHCHSYSYSYYKFITEASSIHLQIQGVQEPRGYSKVHQHPRDAAREPCAVAQQQLQQHKQQRALSVVSFPLHPSESRSA
jgi:hypothetical protein